MLSAELYSKKKRGSVVKEKKAGESTLLLLMAQQFMYHNADCIFYGPVSTVCELKRTEIYGQ